MTTIYLIRHAEAEGNLYRFAQGQSESTITELGHKQIDALAERFRGVPLDVLYSSDLIRTQTTAEAITRYHELTPILSPALREICLGVCEGMSFGDMRKYDPVQMDHFNNDPKSWRAPGAETFDECTMRVYNEVRRIAEANDGKTVAVVSHGMAIRSLISYLLAQEGGEEKLIPHGDNTSVSLLRYNAGVFSIEYFNDNSHLDESLSTFAKQKWWREDSKGRDDANLSYAPFDPRENEATYKAFYRSAWLAAHGDLKFFTPDWFYDSAVRRCAQDPGAIVGIYREDELIGILELDADRGRRDGYGWISLICLKEEHRGAGLGVQPLGYAILHFRKEGMRSLRLHVSEENARAVAFYKRWGFEIIKTEPGAGAPLFLMEKALV